MHTHIKTHKDKLTYTDTHTQKQTHTHTPPPPIPLFVHGRYVRGQCPGFSSKLWILGCLPIFLLLLHRLLSNQWRARVQVCLYLWMQQQVGFIRQFSNNQNSKKYHPKNPHRPKTSSNHGSQLLQNVLKHTARVQQTCHSKIHKLFTNFQYLCCCCCKTQRPNSIRLFTCLPLIHNMWGRHNLHFTVQVTKWCHFMTIIYISQSMKLSSYSQSQGTPGFSVWQK